MSLRIVMWSCPRSLSTALLRSWSQRRDTTAIDEPFYGAWLREQPEVHPNAAALLRSLDTDRFQVAQTLRKGSPTELQYEKQIAQHVTVPFVKRQMPDVRHAFLIRHPARQLNSLARVLGDFPLELSGWPMLEELHAFFGGGAPILDADDLGRDPARALRSLCHALSVPYDDAMLTWPEGKHEAEGAWAASWYESVQASKGFTPPGPLPEIAPALWSHFERVLPIYERLHELRLT
jgi:hypothetical protein